MKKHNGMRPQDIVVLLKIAAKKNSPWMMKDLAANLKISPSEISEAINRSIHAGLLAEDKRSLMNNALLEFLKHGLRYVFPQQPGAMVRGMATAHSAKPLNALIQSNEPYVWAWAKGDVRGFSVSPLHPSVPFACSRDNDLYELLALADVMRLGKIREQSLALKELEKRLL
jgi:predicted transcriptional regulator